MGFALEPTGLAMRLGYPKNKPNTHLRNASDTRTHTLTHTHTHTHTHSWEVNTKDRRSNRHKSDRQADIQADRWTDSLSVQVAQTSWQTERTERTVEHADQQTHKKARSNRQVGRNRQTYPDPVTHLPLKRNDR